MATSFTKDTKWLSTLSSDSVRCGWIVGKRVLDFGKRESMTVVISINRGAGTLRLSQTLSQTFCELFRQPYISNNKTDLA